MDVSSYKKTKSGWQSRWKDELAASEKMVRRFMKRADKVVKRYVDEREEGEVSGTLASRLNLFHSNITTMKAMMYGTLPKVEVSRTYQDSSDDIGRVAALMMGRVLNNDIQENGAEYNHVLRSCLEDRLVPGLGCARVRYEAEFKTVVEQALNEKTQTYEELESEQLQYEDAIVEYHHWRDVRWGWARQWSDVPWVAFRTFLTKEEIKKRFDDRTANQLTYTQQSIEGSKEGGEGELKEAREKAEIWEIWDKDSKRVFWYSENAPAILDSEPDPLKLKGFYPCPPFLAANLTTSHYLPVPDFYMAQDLYNEIDRLQTRIVTITKAVKVVGVYNQQVDGVKRMLQEGTDNDLIPVDQWAMLAEQGGLKGVIDWFPLEDVVMALEKLERLRDSQIALLFQVIGLSDIMRGQGSPTGGRVSAQEQGLKAKFGSVRVQALQDEFGQFASDLLQIKAEIISKHFDAETITYMAGVKSLPRADWMYIGPAVELIKNWTDASLRVKIRPESVAMVDYGQLKQERMEYLNALGLFMQSAGPLLQLDPTITPLLLELLKWGMAGFKGGNEIEGVLDRAIETFQKKPAQQNGDDGGQQARMAEIQAKAQADVAKIQQTLQADIIKIHKQLEADLALIQAKTSAEGQKEVTQAMAARIEDLSQLRSKLAELTVQHNANIREIRTNASVSPSPKSGR